VLQVTAAACGVNNNINKSRPVNPSSTPADVSTMTEIGGDYHAGYSVHAGSGIWRGTARSQVSLISARLGFVSGGGDGRVLSYNTKAGFVPSGHIPPPPPTLSTMTKGGAITRDTTTTVVG
jgi:hypothetical protein